MKFKKAFSFLFIFMFAFVGLIFGCKGKYDKYSIYVEGETSIILHASSSIETDRTHEVTIKYKNAPNENSKNITPIYDQKMFSVTLVEKTDKYAKFKIAPQDNIYSDDLTSEIVFKTAEGNKKCSITVQIVIEITNLFINSNYSAFVVADGKYYSINTDKAFNFEPSNTTQKGIIYSLVDETLKERYGVEVLSDGRMKVESLIDNNGQGLSNFEVKATSENNANLTQTITVDVLKALTLEDFSIITNGANSDLATRYYQLSDEDYEKLTDAEKSRYQTENFEFLKQNGIVLSSNDDKKKTSLFQVVINAASGLDKGNLNITLEKYILNNATIDRNTFVISALNPNIDYLTLNISYKNYEDYKLSLTLPVDVKENATEMLINSSDKTTYEIFDYYENHVGQPFKVNIGKSNAYDKTFKVSIDKNDFAKLVLTYNGISMTNNDFEEKDGVLVSKHNFENNSVIYIKAKVGEENSNEEIDIKFIANGGIDLDSNIKLNIVEGVTSLSFATNKQILYVAKGEKLNLNNQTLAYKVNGNDKGDKLLDKVNLYIENENLISATKDTKAYNFDIEGLNVGTTKIKLVSENGVESEEITVIVYNYSNAEELDEMFDIEMGANLKLVEDKYYLGLEAGTNNANITLKNTNLVTVNSSNIEVAKADVLNAYKVSDNGLIYQVQSISLGETTITIKVSVYNENSLVNNGELTKEITKELTIKTYYPITDVSLKVDKNGIDVVDGADLDLDSKNNKLHVLKYEDIFKISKKSTGNTADSDNLIKIAYNIPSGYSVYNKNLSTNNVEEENADIVIGEDYSLTFMFGDKGFSSSGVHSLFITAKVYDILATEYYPVTFKVNVKEQVKPYKIEIEEEYGFVYLTNQTSLYELKAEVKSEFGKEVTNKNLAYTVKDETILSVNEQGIITPKSSGKTEITIYAKASKYKEDDEYSVYEKVTVVVADGSINLPYILTDFSKLEANKNYTLSSDLQVENSFNGEFGGTINGDFAYKKYSNNNYTGNFKLISSLKGVIFTKLLNTATIKNLDIVVNFQATNDNEYSLFADINEGNIENVNVTYNGNMKFAFAGEEQIGSLVCENLGTITNCSVTGNLEITTNNNLIFGGLVGKNNGTLIGTYNYFNSKTAENYNSTLNLIINTTGGDLTVGGLVGLANSSSINKNLNSKSIIRSNAQTLGGIIGEIDGEKNTTKIENCLFSGILSTTKVGANVGGITGRVTSTIYNLCFVQFTYENTKLGSTEKAFITANGNVGGLIGELNGESKISNSYIQSLVEYGSIGFDSDILASGNVGGLVGQIVENASVEIEISFAEVEISVNGNENSIIGGLIGKAYDFTLNNVYSMVNVQNKENNVVGGFVGEVVSAGNINNAYTLTANNIVGKNTNNVTISSNEVYTSSTVYDMISTSKFSTTPWKRDIYVNSGFPYLIFGSYNLIMQEPQSIKARFVVGNKVNENDIYYYGASENIVVINNDDKQNKALVYYSENLQFSLSEILNITVYPEGAQYNIASSDNSILSVSGDRIRILKTGNVTLKVYYANGRDVVSAEVYFAIVNKIQEIVVEEDFEILKGKTKQLNVKVTGEGGLNFKFNEDVSSYLLYNNGSINEQEINTNLKQHIFTALNEKSEISYTLTPYYNVLFGEEEYKVKDYDLQKKDLSFAIITGATGISTNTTNIYLTEKQTISFDVQVENDTEESGLTICGEEFLTNNEQTITFDSETILLVSVSKNENAFEINVSSNIPVTEEKTVELIISPVSNSNLKLSVFVTLLPSKLLSIELTHYQTTTSAQDIKTMTNIPSPKITPGELGVLQINLHPNYANLRKVLIKSNIVNGASIQLAQLAIDETNENNLVYVKNNGKEDGALLLDFNTSKIIKEGEEIKKQFDGNLYVSTILPSNAIENTIFTITVICYDALSSEPIIQEIPLKAVPLPGAYLAYNNETNIQMAKGTELTLDLIKVNVENVEPDFNYADLETKGVSLEYDEENEKATIYVDILSEITNFEIVTTVRTYINGKFETVQNTTKISVVDFVVNDAYVENAENSIIENNLGSTTTLKVKLNVTKADESLFHNNDGKLEVRKQELERITLRIRALEESISKLNSTFNTITNNNNGSYTYSNIVADTTYANFKTSEQNGYLAITGTKVSTQQIVVLVNYTYDLNGYVKLTTNAGYEIVKNLILEVKTYTTKDNPFPITTYEKFREKLTSEEGGSYILLNDITLPTNYSPISANFESLDGNGYTINLQGFSLTEENTNIGVFSEISENSVVKNLKINILPSTFYLNDIYQYGFEVDALNLESLNFGVLCGVNNGVITNCSVVNENNLLNKKTIAINVKSEENDNINVGLFVGENKGYITNSHVNNYSDKNTQGISIYAKANLSGFVAKNSGKIASSYATNVYIINSSQQLKTAGFVVENTNQIVTSFVEGDRSNIDNYGQILSGGISAIYNVGGFVYSNAGSIKDCYSNIPLTTNMRSAGFVYDNTSGKINTCFSASLIQTGSSSYRNFTGNNEENIVLNTKGGITQSYYLSLTSIKGSDLTEYSEPANAISEFDENSLEGFVCGVNGIWNVSGSLPVLIDATNEIFTQRKLLDNSQLNDDSTKVYNYVYVNYQEGTEKNPIIVSNTQEFIDAITDTNNLYNYYMFGKKITTNINYKYIRIVKDLDLSTIIIDGEEQDSQEEVQKLQNIIFAGNLNGNGMNINNIVITAKSSDTNYDSFGLFKQIGVDFIYNSDKSTKNNLLDEDNCSVVKNINFHINSISATITRSVGVLTGEVINSKLYNINIVNNNGVVVTGNNMVGGVAGRISGQSKVSGVTSNVSVMSTFNSEIERKNYVEIESKKINNVNYGSINDAANNKVGFAGGLFGVVDIYDAKINYLAETTTSQSKQTTAQITRDFKGGISINNNHISYAKVHGDIQVIGEISGGLFGYVGTNSAIHDVQFELVESSTQNIIANYSAGGIVGENHGLINYAVVSAEKYLQEEYDRNKTALELRNMSNYLFSSTSNTATYVGGLVGINKDGDITYSYNRANIIAENSRFVGGLVGLFDEGKIMYAYTTANVVAQKEIKSQEGYTTQLKGYTGGVIGRLNSYIETAYDMSNIVGANNIDTTKSSTEYYLTSFAGYNAVSQDKMPNVFETTINGPSCIGSTFNANGEKLEFENYLDKNTQCFDSYASDENWDKVNFVFPVLTYNPQSVNRAVESEEGLRNMVSGGSYTLTKDIYLTSPWSPAYLEDITLTSQERSKTEWAIHGTKYYKIYNLNIVKGSSDTSSNIGFFSTLKNSTVKDITFVVGTTFKDPNNSAKAPDMKNGEATNDANWEKYSSLGLQISNNTNSGYSMGVLAGVISAGSTINNISIITKNGGTAEINTNLQNVGVLAGNISDYAQVSDIHINCLSNEFKNLDYQANFNIISNNSKEEANIGGLFGKANNSNIKNVNIKNVAINTTADKSNVGLIGGNIGNSAISIFLVENSKIQVPNNSKSYIYSGFGFGSVNNLSNDYGENCQFSFKRCEISIFSAVKIYVGGFAGQVINSSIFGVDISKDCLISLNAGERNDETYLGGLIGRAGTLTDGNFLRNSYSNGQISLEYNGGSDIQVLVGGLVGCNGFNETVKEGNNLTSKEQTYNGLNIGDNDTSSSKTYSKVRINVSSITTSSNSKAYIGGLVGRNSGNIKNVVGLSSIKSTAIDSYKTGKSTISAGIATNEKGKIENVSCAGDLAGVSIRDEEYGVEFESYNNLIKNFEPLDFDADQKSENNENIGLSILNPQTIENQTEWDALVTGLNGETENSETKYYILNCDISSSATITNFNHVLIGNGHTITLQSTLFNTIGNNAVVSNLNIIAKTNEINSYDLDLTDDCLNSNTAFAQENQGVVFGINIVGNLHSSFTANDDTASYISSFVIKNTGTIINSSSKVNMIIKVAFIHYGDEKKDAISGFANENAGLILNSYSTSNIEIFESKRDINYIVPSALKNIAGFIYNNTKFVANCYSATTMPESDAKTIYPFEINSTKNLWVQNCYFDVNAVAKYQSENGNSEEAKDTKANPKQTNELTKDLFTGYTSIWAQNNKINYSYIYINNINNTNVESTTTTTATEIRSTYSESNGYEINHLGTLNSMPSILEGTTSEIKFVLTRNVNAKVVRVYKERSSEREKVLTNYTPINLSGKKVTFNGNGFAICNLKLENSTKITNNRTDFIQYVGLFYTTTETTTNTTSSTVKNLALLNMKYVINNLTTTPTYIGGIVAYGDTIVQNCYTEGVITTDIVNNSSENKEATLYIGGLAGNTSGEITNSVSNVQIDLTTEFQNSTGFIGGVVGETKNSITNTMSLNKIKVNTFVKLYMGGIAGKVVGTETTTDKTPNLKDIVTLSQVIYGGYYQHYYETLNDTIYYNINAVFGKVDDTISTSDIKYSSKLSLVEDSICTSSNILNAGEFFASNITSEDNKFMNSSTSSYVLKADNGSILNPIIITSLDNLKYQTTDGNGNTIEIKGFESGKNYIVSVDTIELSKTTTGNETNTIGEYEFSNGYIIFDKNGENVKVTFGVVATRLFSKLENAIVSGIDFDGNYTEITTSGILADLITNTTINNVNAYNMYLVTNKPVESEYNANGSVGLFINTAVENSVITNVETKEGRIKANVVEQRVAGVVGYAMKTTFYNVKNYATITSASIAYELSGIVAEARNCSINFVENNGLIYIKGSGDVNAAGISADIKDSSISFSKNTAKVQTSSDKVSKSSGLIISKETESSVVMYYCYNSGNVVSIGTQDSLTTGLLEVVEGTFNHKLFYSYNKGAVVSSGKIFALTNGTHKEGNKGSIVNYCYNIGGGYSSVQTVISLVSGDSSTLDKVIGVENLMDKIQIDNIEYTYAEVIKNSSQDFTMTPSGSMYFPVIAIIDEKYELKQENGTYQISTAFDLYYWLSFVASGNVDILKDIDMSGYHVKPITKEFNGIFNGNNHQISDIIISESNIDDSSLYVGFIAKNGGTIQNVNFVDPQIINNSKIATNIYIGVVAAYNKGNIQNVMVSASRDGIKFISSQYKGVHASKGRDYIYIGGITGKNLGTINTCEIINIYDGATIDVKYQFTIGVSSLIGVDIYTGGLVGENERGRIENSCHFGYMGIVVDNSGRTLELGEIGNLVMDVVISTPVAEIDSFTGPIYGKNSNGAISNNYALSNLSGAENPSTIIGYYFENAYTTKSNNLYNCLEKAEEIESQQAIEGVKVISTTIETVTGAVLKAKKIIKAIDKATDFIKTGKNIVKVGLSALGKIVPGIGTIYMIMDTVHMAQNLTSNIPILDDATYDATLTGFDKIANFKSIYGEWDKRTKIKKDESGNVTSQEEKESLVTTLFDPDNSDETGFKTFIEPEKVYIQSQLSSHESVYSVPKLVDGESNKYCITSADELAYAIQLQKKNKASTFIILNSIDLRKKVWPSTYSDLSKITIFSNDFEIIYPTTITFGQGESSVSSVPNTNINNDFGAFEKLEKDNKKAKFNSFKSAFNSLKAKDTDKAIESDIKFNITTKEQLYLIGLYLNVFKDDVIWSSYLNFAGITFTLQNDITLELEKDFKTTNEKDEQIANPLNQKIADAIGGGFITSAMVYDTDKSYSYLTGIDTYYGISDKYYDTALFNGTLNGNAKAITIKNGTLFNYTNEFAKICNLKINVECSSLNSTTSMGFVVNENMGTIENVSVYVKINKENTFTINKLFSESVECDKNDKGSYTNSATFVDAIWFGLICGTNSGKLTNCSANTSVDKELKININIEVPINASKYTTNDDNKLNAEKQNINNAEVCISEEIGLFVGLNEGKIEFDKTINKISLKVENKVAWEEPNSNTINKNIYLNLGAICGTNTISDERFYNEQNNNAVSNQGVFGTKINQVDLNAIINNLKELNIGGITGSSSTTIQDCYILSFSTNNEIMSVENKPLCKIGLLVGEIKPTLYIQNYKFENSNYNFYYFVNIPSIKNSFAASKTDKDFNLFGKNLTLYYQTTSVSNGETNCCYIQYSYDNENWLENNRVMLKEKEGSNNTNVYIDNHLITEKDKDGKYYSSSAVATIDTKTINFSIAYDDNLLAYNDSLSIEQNNQNGSDLEIVKTNRTGCSMSLLVDGNGATEINEGTKFKVVGTTDLTESIKIKLNYHTAGIPITNTYYETQNVQKTDEQGNLIYIDNEGKETTEKFDENGDENEPKMVDKQVEVSETIRIYQYNFDDSSLTKDNGSYLISLNGSENKNVEFKIELTKTYDKNETTN